MAGKSTDWCASFLTSLSLAGLFRQQHTLAMTSRPRYALRKRKRTGLQAEVVAKAEGNGPQSSDNASDSDASSLSLQSESEDSEYENPVTLKQLTPRKRERKKVSTVKALAIDDISSISNDSPSTFTFDEIARVRKLLLPWYSRNYRKLPWRPAPLYNAESGTVRAYTGVDDLLPTDPGAPYAVWVSEIMSQQTRISVVCEYHKRWMAEFPSVQHLANASPERVNELWSGLGYYRRARMLQQGAKVIAERHDGVIPSDVKTLLSIPGIGRYTAGAVSSIAFNKAVPLVDGNVERVLARLRTGCAAIVEKASTSKKSEHYWKLATGLVQDIECAGDLNQGLMELGATVCTPKRPKCSECPLTAVCGAFSEAEAKGIDASEHASKYPIKRTAQKCKVRDETVSVCVVRREGKKKSEPPRYLMLQRPNEGLLAGLWEFPTVVHETKDDSKHKLSKDIDEKITSLLLQLGEIDGGSPLRTLSCGEVTHIFSHIRQKLLVRVLTFKPSMESHLDRDSKMRWIEEEEMKTAAISTQMKKVFKKAAQTKFNSVWQRYLQR